MLLFLPLLSFVAWFRALRFAVSGVRERLLVAAVWWILSLAVITELLSAFQSISQETLAIAWAVTAAVTLAADAWWHREKPRNEHVTFNWQTLERTDWALLGISIAFLILIGVTAVIAPPSGWDVTAYHMPRVMEWAAQRSVGFFPTNYYVQDFAPPLAGWMLLHLYLLQGSDRLVHVAQWLGCAGSAVAVSAIAEEFGCAIRGQLVAALICLTIPQGVLAASGAKNGWLVAFWLCVSVVLILRWQRNPRWLYVVTLGIALGALVLTKGTADAFAPPIAAALLLVTPRTVWRKIPVAVVLAASIMVLINATSWSNNYRASHSIFGPAAPDMGGKYVYRVKRITPTEIAANLLRETSVHFAPPGEFLSRKVTHATRHLIEFLGVNPDDPGQIRPDKKFEIHPYCLNEYYAGNPLHLLLAIVSFLIIIFAMRNVPRETALALGIVAAFVLYCAVFKWEIMDARRHLPLFVVACPLIAIVLDQKFARARVAVVLILVAFAIPDIFFNTVRPLVSTNSIRRRLHRDADPSAESILFANRDRLYLAQDMELLPTYLPAARAAREQDCRHIGIDTSDHPFAYGYILMGLIDSRGPQRIFRYVGVNNFTGKYTSKIDEQAPCMVLCVRCLHDPAKMAKYSAEFPKVQSFGTLVLFRPADH